MLPLPTLLLCPSPPVMPACLQPSNQACEALGVGLTIFKRLCRKFGLQRWPYRTLKKQVRSEEG